MPSKVARMPMAEASRVTSATSAACSSALVGMQPRCRQVPPTLSFSMRATERPSSAARSGRGVAAAAAAQDDEVEGVLGHRDSSPATKRMSVRTVAPVGPLSVKP